MSTRLKWLVCVVVIVALAIVGLAIVLPDSPASTTLRPNMGADPSTKGKRPNQFACERPQCTEPCDLASLPTGKCSDGTSSWDSTYACCCCNEDFNKRNFYPPK